MLKKMIQVLVVGGRLMKWKLGVCNEILEVEVLLFKHFLPAYTSFFLLHFAFKKLLFQCSENNMHFPTNKLRLGARELKSWGGSEGKNRNQRSINVIDLQQQEDANLDELKEPLVMVEQYWSLDSYFSGTVIKLFRLFRLYIIC